MEDKNGKRMPIMEKEDCKENDKEASEDIGNIERNFQTSVVLK